MTRPTYKTWDGAMLGEGDRPYNAQDKKLGVIGPPEPEARKLIGYGPDWFNFDNEDGSLTVLHGKLICSLEWAEKTGFIRRKKKS